VNHARIYQQKKKSTLYPTKQKNYKVSRVLISQNF